MTSNIERLLSDEILSGVLLTFPLDRVVTVRCVMGDTFILCDLRRPLPQARTEGSMWFGDEFVSTRYSSSAVFS